MRLVVNDRVDVARIIGADGAHLGQDDLSPKNARRLVADTMLLGLSTHNLEQVESGTDEPVDYIAFGPIFSSLTKPRAGPALGIDPLRKARSLTTKPLVAIGGISRANAAQVLKAGCDGIAVISDVLLASSIEGCMEEFRRILDKV